MLSQYPYNAQCWDVDVFAGRPFSGKRTLNDRVKIHKLNNEHFNSNVPIVMQTANIRQDTQTWFEPENNVWDLIKPAFFLDTYHNITHLLWSHQFTAAAFNAVHAAGECRRQVIHWTHFVKKCQSCGILWPYLESPREIHSTEYKHTWYWFINSWNRHQHFRKLRKQT